jgi:hypothetical protein
MEAGGGRVQNIVGAIEQGLVVWWLGWRGGEKERKMFCWGEAKAEQVQRSRQSREQAVSWLAWRLDGSQLEASTQIKTNKGRDPGLTFQLAPVSSNLRM